MIILNSGSTVLQYHARDSISALKELVVVRILQSKIDGISELRYLIRVGY